jgi:hypothetical protein
MHSSILKKIIPFFYKMTISQIHGDPTDGNRHGLEEALGVPVHLVIQKTI